MTDILKMTIKEMPSTFTSNYFRERAVANGYPQKLLKNKIAAILSMYATNEAPMSKTWHKFTKDVSNNSEAEMIRILKSKGYKIMKPKTEWEEL